MLIANLLGHGGDLEQEIFNEITGKSSFTLRIVSGYVGKETIRKLSSLVAKAKSVDLQLVVGMAAKEGLSLSTYQSLKELDSAISANAGSHPDSGVFVYFSDGSTFARDRGIHAKAYLIGDSTPRKFIVGSSNFSNSGLSIRGNIEMNFVDNNEELTGDFEKFYRGLHSGNHLVLLKNVENFPIKGSASLKRKRALPSGLTRSNLPSNFQHLPFIDLDLSRNINGQTRSNLNTCFGKGRWARSTGHVIPRSWYEVELICSTAITSNPVYPKGDFWVTTTDGFRFEARTQGDYFKNLRSKHSLENLGLWIKGQCLEDAGALSDNPQELVTSETFEAYGNSILRMYKVSETEYIFDFPRDRAFMGMEFE